MKSAIEGAQIQIGNALAPVVLKIIDRIKSMAQAFGAMSSETQKTTIKVVAFIAALGPLTSIAGGVTRLVLGMSQAFTAVAAKGFTANMRFKRMAVMVRTFNPATAPKPHQPAEPEYVDRAACGEMSACIIMFFRAP
jgi:hypothetical protein